MSNQGKSKLTRRDFLRLMGLGAGAAAVGIAAKPLGGEAALSTNPSFEARHFSDPAGRPNRPWWVKTVDKPTVEIDWEKVQRYNERYIPHLEQGTTRGGGFKAYVGEDKDAETNAAAKELLQRGVEENIPGYTLKDQAIDASQDVRVPISFLGPQGAKTPE
ncbi:MAG TPA: reductive dehalogenase domain-containing protein, partial [Anaerolineales bacterium]|nr:reductive dehalogenase domain-containing protein [Anaerolineales bacterium]